VVVPAALESSFYFVFCWVGLNRIYCLHVLAMYVGCWCHAPVILELEHRSRCGFLWFLKKLTTLHLRIFSNLVANDFEIKIKFRILSKYDPKM